MIFLFVILALLTVTGALAAMSLRNPVHCALWLVVAFGGLAAIYLQLGAQFVGLAQILVYIGAVAILIVFAILLTRGAEPPQESIVSGRWFMGVAIAIMTFGSLALAILASSAVTPRVDAKTDVSADVSVANIGSGLMTDYVLPLEVLGVLLTVALIGAVIVALREKEAGTAASGKSGGYNGSTI